MRAWLLDRPGAPTSLRMAEVDSPWRSPVDGRRTIEVLVQVESVGLNPVDVRTAAAGHPRWTYPHIPGLDVAGRVVAVHADALDRREQGWLLPAPGTRVVFHQDLREGGGFAELVAVPPDALAVVPREIDPIAAASLPEVEEAAVIAAHRSALRMAHRLLLILVPDRAERSDRLAAMLEASEGWQVARRSSEEEPDDETQVYIADAPSEMGLWYRLAPVTFMGGSLYGAGSQRDPFEAAVHAQ